MDFHTAAQSCAGVAGQGGPEAKRAAAVAIALELVNSKIQSNPATNLENLMEHLGAFADIVQAAMEVK